MIFLFDVAVPGSGAIAAGAGIVFFIILAAVSFIAFRIFRKTMKMAFRMAVLCAVLFSAVAGSFGIWWFASSKPSPRPVPQRNR